LISLEENGAHWQLQGFSIPWSQRHTGMCFHIPNPGWPFNQACCNSLTMLTALQARLLICRMFWRPWRF
jgi:hypothetical protein